MSAYAELIRPGDVTLSTLAEDARELLSRVEQDVWEIGRILSLARALCDDAELAAAAGYPGASADKRFGKWLSTNFVEFSPQALLNYRRLWEVYGERRDQLRIPQSGLYLLAAPNVDDKLRAKVEQDAEAEPQPTVQFVKKRLGFWRNELKRLSARKPRALKTAHVVEADFRDRRNWAQIEDGSVDLVFTDPPYAREDLDLYDLLGEFCAKKLVDGGSLVTYLGDYAIAEVIQKVTAAEGMHFVWPLVVLHEGNGQLLNLARQSGLRVKHKQLLWFMRGGTTRVTQEVFESVIPSRKEKDGHEWQQGEMEADYLIRALSRKDCLVFDPFCGAGTTKVAAIKAGRQCITWDKDRETVRKASSRIAEKIRADEQ